MPAPRLLTKSRFKIGCECPTKLFFAGKKEYGNKNIDNAFLEALAEGGFQVGALARLYHEGGVAIETLDVEEALSETNRLLARESIVLFEAALRFDNLLVRVDVLIKRGDHVELIEVKAKSFDPNEENPFYNKTQLKKGTYQLSTDWEPYLLDIAFQTYVAQKAFPKWKITSALMLADKSTTASVDGINQRFFLKKNAADKVDVEVAPGTTRAHVGERILTKVSVDAEVKLIFEKGIENQPFSEYVTNLAEAYVADRMISPVASNHCKSCEFRIDDKAKKQGLKSGFEECWKIGAHLSPSDFDRPMVFDIWNFRKSAKLIEEGRYFFDQIEESDIDPRTSKDGRGLSSSQRQWLQVQKVKEHDSVPYLDAEGLASEMSGWAFPLHFIDFETTMVAIPFHKDRRPYEQIAFQFSHHVLSEDGKIEHRSQHIDSRPGIFPNFDFVRALKAALGPEGTIFRFAAHENTVLCQILAQLQKSNEKDRDELIAWIKTVTKSGGDSTIEWEGPRNMVDMCELVKRYFYHPMTRGSNSIKKVLPAILATSGHLQARYSKPVYGSHGGISSKNFKDWQWIKKDESGNVVDPYKLLPPIFDDLDLETMDALITEGSIADGGAAMTAYARMQFTQMTAEERERVSQALLKYCELDTFAMVLIYEYWTHEVATRSRKKAA